MSKIEIDSRKGGNGDTWMRLISLYAVAGLLPSVKIVVCIPPFMYALALHIFGDRLEIKNNSPGNAALTYTSLGIKDILKKAVTGSRFISPYGKAVLYKKGRFLRWVTGNMAYKIFDLFGIIQTPPFTTGIGYQGYQEIIAIKKFRKIPYETFCLQLKKDAACLQYRSTHDIPVSSSLHIPLDMNENILVFPTGTARQFVPVWWAKNFLPLAYYAFFYKDEAARVFINEGLKVIYFYEAPGDIIELCKQAWHTISTDSFPSHLLQYATDNCSITITEVPKAVIISPVFSGNVIDAVANCHPCLHLDRGNHPLCAAGYKECINWKSKTYTDNILAAIKRRNIVIE